MGHVARYCWDRLGPPYLTVFINQVTASIPPHLDAGKASIMTWDPHHELLSYVSPRHHLSPLHRFIKDSCKNDGKVENQLRVHPFLPPPFSLYSTTFFFTPKYSKITIESKHFSPISHEVNYF